MILRSTLETAMTEAMRLAATRVPPDVERALRAALAEETGGLARMHLELSLRNMEEAAAGRGLVCGDTGFPLFFLRFGGRTAIEGGLASIHEAAERATARLTAEAFLRPTMVDPLTRRNPGNNLGGGMPRVEWSVAGDGEDLELVAAPKGGGSEIFGTFYRMLFPSDGVAGVKAFLLDCIRESCYAGKICPPAIVGVGIGGTADFCMSLAKKAALLRAVGSVHADPAVAALERDLLAASRGLGIGPMGSRGTNAVLAVHVETAFTHTAALPVAFNAQCLVGRRWKARIAADNAIVYDGRIA